MKTRLRRYYWSAIRPGGVALEYTGTGVEKLLGFLVAVVVMAFYIGVFNLILMFLSFALLNDNFAAYAMSFVGVIPIYFYASYRARRYVLARTRWRGLRFGIDVAAWSYAWRAMLHWLATIITLGFLWPRQVFWMEKFRIDRTWFGRERFQQEGRWTQLLPAAIHLYIGLAITLASIGLGFVDEAFLALLMLGIPWLLLGFMHFQVRSFRVLADCKRLGEHISFTAAPRTFRVIVIYLFGYFLAGIVLMAGLIGLIFAGVFALAEIDPELLRVIQQDGIFSVDSASGRFLVFAGAGLGYFSLFIFWGVLSQIFVTLPLMHHYAETVSIHNGHHFGAVSQRPRDEFSEAEGFAEALDIGAAI